MSGWVIGEIPPSEPFTQFLDLALPAHSQIRKDHDSDNASTFGVLGGALACGII
jgi:hypothetical protein